MTWCPQLAPDDAWRCPHCKVPQQGTVKLSLWTLPEILIIHLKRFRQVAEQRHKLTTLVRFPLRGLDMAPHVAQRGQPGGQLLGRWAPWQPPLRLPPGCPREHLYDLYAVCNHHGSMQGGHYTGERGHLGRGGGAMGLSRSRAGRSPSAGDMQDGIATTPGQAGHRDVSLSTIPLPQCVPAPWGSWSPLQPGARGIPAQSPPPPSPRAPLPPAFCCNALDGRWYSYDDSRVEGVREAEVSTRSAYILFYQRRRAPGSGTGEPQMPAHRTLTLPRATAVWAHTALRVTHTCLWPLHTRAARPAAPPLRVCTAPPTRVPPPAHAGRSPQVPPPPRGTGCSAWPPPSPAPTPAPTPMPLARWSPRSMVSLRMLNPSPPRAPRPP